MSRQAVQKKNVISLKGSAKTVCEFFDYGVNSILYQRGIYPTDEFGPQQQYGLTVQVTKNPTLRKYIKDVTEQMRDWVEQGVLQRVVLVVSNVATKEVLERWTFQVDTEKDVLEGKVEAAVKPEKEIAKEIAQIIRQITSAVTFLPLLEDACVFDLIVYTTKTSVVPAEWEDSDPRYIKGNSTEVKLRTFDTKVHKVEAMVAYKVEEAADT